MSGKLNDYPYQVTLRGDLSREAVTGSLDKIKRLIEVMPTSVEQVHVVISSRPNPSRAPSVRIEVSAVVACRTIRAHVAATDPAAAADLILDRLRRRVDQARRHNPARYRRSRAAAEQEWRHGGLPPHPATSPRRAPGVRPIVKHKTHLLEPMTEQQAVDEMELLDHDFYLFVDSDTGADAVVHRRHDGSYGVLGPTSGAAGPHEECGRPPAMTAEHARECLEVTTDVFLFYRDPGDDRGRILYRRYDGNYGLIAAS